MSMYQRCGQMGTVYFAQSLATRWVKIGWTHRKIHLRLSGIAAAHGAPVTLLRAIPGTLDLEADFHRKHKDFRRQGEWFDPVPSVLADAHHASDAPAIVAPPAPAIRVQRAHGLFFAVAADAEGSFLGDPVPIGASGYPLG